MPSIVTTENKTTHANKVTQQFIDRYPSFYSNIWKVIIVEGAKNVKLWAILSLHVLQV